MSDLSSFHTSGQLATPGSSDIDRGRSRVVVLQVFEDSESPQASSSEASTLSTPLPTQEQQRRPAPLEDTTNIQTQTLTNVFTPSRKPSPGLLERIKLLNTRQARQSVTIEVGRIPEDDIKRIEQLRREQEKEITRRGRAWSGPAAPQIRLSSPSLDENDFVAAVQMAGTHVHGSDVSSIISVSDRMVPSDSEDEDQHIETQKYRLPDLRKSRGSSRNGFVLEDGSTMEHDRPPTPPPKDDPPSYRNSCHEGDLNELPMENVSDHGSIYSFNPAHNLSRTGSIYTLSRASFANQLSQLTSIKLPQASSLASSIAAIPTSTGAVRALNDASNQIKIWIKKVSDVLDGLDAEDDVEWAAAGGREGLGDVDSAIRRFEGLIDVYVTAIEQLELRDDIQTLPAEYLQTIVDQMDKILKDWKQIKITLQGVKEQVEVAMEWEEMWNTVLGEIGQEVEALSRLIFEMEERRHRGMLEAMAEPGQGLDINELETIVEEAPLRDARDDPLPAPAAPSEDDKNLVGLFARMQPLRASLDFLPMRLSAFLQRATSVFPTGCDELERRQEHLEAKYKKLEADAESLRKELGEDRWVVIFRKASEKALKMSESVERSIVKLRDSLDEGIQHTNPTGLVKKIESYEAKKTHYGPAIEQVLGIIDRGVKQRLTVNGEILRLQADMQQKWADLGAHIKGMDFALEQMQVYKGHNNLRDSVSTIFSEQRSVGSSVGGNMFDTPGSSPASSVVLLSRQSSEQGLGTPYGKSRQGSFASSTTSRSTATGKRYSSMPASMVTNQNLQNSQPLKTPVSRSSVQTGRAVSGVSSRLYSPPTSSTTRSVSRSIDYFENVGKPSNSRPRWNTSTNLDGTPIGHNFKPLSLTTPSPYRNGSLTPSQRASRSSMSPFPQPSPLGQSVSNTMLAVRPPSVQALNRSPSTVPRAKPQAHSAARPKRPSSVASLSHPPRAASGITSPTGSSHLPRSSMYIAPGSIPGIDSSPSPSPYARSTRSSASEATLTNRSRRASSVQPHHDDESKLESGVELSVEISPSKRLPKTRPSTSLAGRRISMLPQPKKTVSNTIVENDSTRTPSRAGSRLSRIGGRMSSMGFGSTSGGSERVWK
ncbi:Karyogamy protein KAR9 [Venturia nashicola]|uniref:Karyogamy protein KAR9 n=1 Tax=Venturia nashicola TaxID=86259 RepID=A0A4Z1P615_9PEZI|nr:Karyogamy protein KAR9 [Venturia nashicola]TLD35051.1 Karyogamy protein KAR9 [Venturia nashicola]